jgi:hypothetical protein
VQSDAKMLAVLGCWPKRMDGDNDVIAHRLGSSSLLYLVCQMEIFIALAFALGRRHSSSFHIVVIGQFVRPPLPVRAVKVLSPVSPPVSSVVLLVDYRSFDSIDYVVAS